MDNRRMRIKMSGNEMEALMMGYQEAVAQMEHEARTEHYTLHETLLLEHAINMKHKLELLHDKGQLKYTLALSPVEAMAVYQLWQRPFDITVYSSNAVRKVYEAIEERQLSIV